MTNALVSDVIMLDEAADVEKELTIFSAVRSNNKLTEIDILGDYRSLNTLLTRGRRGLIVVGDIETLLIDPNWQEWLFWSIANGIAVNI